MKEIQLTQGKVTFVDDKNFEWLNEWKWYAWREPKSGLFYAKASSRIYSGDWSAKPLSMARLIIQAAKGKLVDHRDRNTLNNQRSNLRLCDFSQSNLNRTQPRKHQFRGVQRINANLKRPYRALFKFRGIQHNGGYHTSPEEAALAYDELVKRYCPDFGILNFGEKK